MYDLLLKGGRVIDPASDIDRVLDVAFADGKVAKLAPDLPSDSARAVRDVAGKIVTPGLIDLHTHIYWGGTSIGIEPDPIARQGGCTTLVDAGTAGPANLLGLRRHVIERSEVRILAFINVAFPGIFAFSGAVMVGECLDIRLLNARECLRVAREHADIVVGVKVRVGQGTSGANGIGPLDIALEVADELGMPVMAHLDYPPPSRREVLERLRPGDVLTHCFRPFPNAPAKRGAAVHDEVLAARQRGVIFDIGHGMGSFGFATAETMLANDFLPDTISSDVHSLSVDGPAVDLLVTMSKFLCLGMPLGEIVRATTLAPAKVIGRDDLGRLTEGAAGDATVLEIRDGAFPLTDSLGRTITGVRRLFAPGIVANGAWWHPAASSAE